MSGWVFVSGPMGSGKSSVGEALARRRGARFVDLDARVAEGAGVGIPEIIATRGEAVFRELEREAALSLLEEAPAVVALGGGTVADDALRRTLLGCGVVVTLHADIQTLLSRVGGGEGRPLAPRLAELLEHRAAAYAECHGEVDAARPIEEVVDEAARIAEQRSVVVPLGLRTYRVSFEPLAALAGLVRPIGPTGTLVVTDRNVLEPWGRSVAEALGARATLVLAPGEENKTLAAVERIWDGALSAGIDRGGLIVAVGGGVVGDLAGFAASTLMRGVALVHVPTTMLAIVDASVGGKTGFDRPEGKNLVGTFHQPRHVLVDVGTLSTLSDVELSSGLAEVVKSAWLDGEEAVAALERDAEALLARDPRALARAVRRSVTQKAGVVARDERESGQRMLLNLGHTMGHAIEAARGLGAVRHGEAVALGMVGAFRVAARLGDERAVRHEARLCRLLERLRLPVDVDASWDDVASSLVGVDKKRRGGLVSFILPGAPGEARTIPLDRDAVRP